MNSESANILISGVNWLGDSCMTMPAIQLFKKKNPTISLSILVKPKLAPLWEMHDDIDHIITLSNGLGGTLATSRKLSSKQFDTAYIFPNSWRSALIPHLSRIPVRTGTPGHKRSFMLTNLVSPSIKITERHQMWEYVHILDLDDYRNEIELPSLNISNSDLSETQTKFGLSSDNSLVGILPGAARGSSKRWPPDHFITAGKNLISETGCHVAVFGTSGESALCKQVAKEIGESAYNLAGKTSLPELTALLGSCKCVLCNDSGGMHLAAAAGTTVVAVFGLTDPAATGPIGAEHQIISANDVSARSRNIAKESKEAEEALLSIQPNRVSNAAIEIMRQQ